MVLASVHFAHAHRFFSTVAVDTNTIHGMVADDDQIRWRIIICCSSCL
jgi:hypothetical protein